MVKTALSPVELLAEVADPELPFLSIVDLGILRDVEVDGSMVRVTITPTYSGCPAMDAIRSDIDSDARRSRFRARDRHQTLASMDH